MRLVRNLRGAQEGAAWRVTGGHRCVLCRRSFRHLPLLQAALKTEIGWSKTSHCSVDAW